MKKILKNIPRNKLANTTNDSSVFSRFFREASFEEKKRVFMEVAQKANEEQRKILEQSRLDARTP